MDKDLTGRHVDQLGSCPRNSVMHNSIHYRTHEHETIAVFEALMKWEDKILGRKFTLVTDHKGLEYFETQKNLSDRQVQWWEFLSRFNYTIMHVDGMDNKVADCLSCYYENDASEDNHSENTYDNADIRLDPDGKLLPTDRYMELRGAATSVVIKTISPPLSKKHKNKRELKTETRNNPTMTHIYTQTNIHEHWSRRPIRRGVPIGDD